MQFVHQPLAWGFLLVMLPLLIHLINMMRHRRVKWAAMDFLLASYRKHRRWVWLKQLLLLLLRMAAIAAVVAMLAQLVSQDQWSILLGKRTTHHFVLLDDSLSMAERSGSGSAFDQGRRAISAMTSDAANSDQTQRITLLRFSQAARASAADQLASAADLNAAAITIPLEQLLEEQGRTLQVSQLALDPLPSLDLAERLIRDTKNQRCVLHIVSDFRERDWNQPAEVRESLNRLDRLGADINFIRCAESTANLAVESLEPELGTQAAGVPLFVNVTVRNRSPRVADQVRLRTRSVFYPTTAAGTESTPQEAELPDLLIDRIEPGEAVTRTFQVYFPTAGQHIVSVELPTDTLEADNQRWCVVRLEEGESALIVDGDPSERSAYYLESVFRPGTKTKTGIAPLVQPLSYLRDASDEQLARHRVIYLLDVPPLDDRTLTNLRTYVERGGGLACFLGPNAQSAFYSKWYDAEFFPVPAGSPKVNTTAVESTTSEIRFTEHPVFRALSTQRNPFASAIRIRQYHQTPSRWKPSEDSTIRVLASLQQGQPLVVERTVGSGHVVAFLTSLALEWNNWSLQPSFVVVMLQLHSYLAQPDRPRSDRKVGDMLTVQVDAREFQPELTFDVPTEQSGVTREFVKLAEGTGRSDATLLTSVIGATPGANGIGETDFRGVYNVRVQTIDRREQTQRYALNVDPRESDLQTLTSGQLRQAVEPIRVTVYDADQRLATTVDSRGNSWSNVLFWVLLGILLLEQWVAYRVSYHPYAMQPTGGTA